MRTIYFLMSCLMRYHDDLVIVRDGAFFPSRKIGHFSLSSLIQNLFFIKVLKCTFAGRVLVVLAVWDTFVQADREKEGCYNCLVQTLSIAIFHEGQSIGRMDFPWLSNRVACVRVKAFNSHAPCPQKGPPKLLLSLHLKISVAKKVTAWLWLVNVAIKLRFFHIFSISAG